MTRLLKLALTIFTIVSLASAQFVKELNTPIGPVAQGAKVQVSWTLLDGVDATGKTGEFSATDTTSKNTIVIDPAVPLAPPNYLWTVGVPPGTYNLGLNDGSGLKQSGEVVVKAPAGGPAPPGGAAPPAGGAAPPPAPAKGGATPPPAGGAGGATPPPAGGAAGGATPPAAGGAAGGTTPPAAGGAAGGASPAGGAGSSTPSSSSTDSSPPASISSPSSASSILSGYEVVFSLLGVAIAMLQF